MYSVCTVQNAFTYESHIFSTLHPFTDINICIYYLYTFLARQAHLRFQILNWFLKFKQKMSVLDVDNPNKYLIIVSLVIRDVGTGYPAFFNIRYPAGYQICYPDTGSRIYWIFNSINKFLLKYWEINWGKWKKCE